ncbi:MAG: class I SAM-dependent methyltransferase [Proteobacteria bacterium]|nr:class I SAM-dependent methyltransferase [Desulfobulbaceae bacterium]MBU4152014.1 class I SAM-dependent methyltransferase [Pseudomonadota bacterium]
MTEMKAKASFWEATGRKKITSHHREAAIGSYRYNYTKYLPASKDSLIVDLGCSDGISLQWLAGEGYRNVVGVDSDEVAIAKAGEWIGQGIPQVRLYAMDIVDFVKGLEVGSVDVFLMMNVIEHINKKTLLALIEAIREKLRPEGILIAQTGNIENPMNFGLFARDFTHEIPFTANSLRQLMNLCGFDHAGVHVNPLRYRLTVKNCPLWVSSKVCGISLKLFALAMRIRIDITSPMMYCLAKKRPVNSRVVLE